MVTSLAVAADFPWIDVPFVRQVRAGCGPASIAMVMQYWVQHEPGLDAIAADAERIDEALPASDRGTLGSDLRTYLEAHGFSAFVFDGESEDLTHHLAKGRPLVVCLAPKGRTGRCTLLSSWASAKARFCSTTRREESCFVNASKCSWNNGG
jgi:hypothetical protein